MAKYMLPGDEKQFDPEGLRDVLGALQQQAKPRSLEQSTLELYKQTAPQRNLEHAPSLLGTKNLADYLQITNNNYFANVSSDKETPASQRTTMYNTQPEPINSSYQAPLLGNDYNRAA